MDFDAHDGNALRARSLALAAFYILLRNPQLYVILSTSGSDGWHLFAFTREFHSVDQWTSLFKQVAQLIGAEVVPGICEIFPGEVRPGSLPYGIRAPGTWNPRSDSLGFIAYSSISPLLAEASEERKEYPFLCPATNRVDKGQLHDRGKVPLYRGVGGEWKVQFAITQPSTRRNQLKDLVHQIFRQVGREVARRNAEAQYNGATSRPRATLPEHLSEFDALWDRTTAKCADLTDGERQPFARLSTGTEGDAFRILRGFARKAIDDQSRDFLLSVQHVAVAIGVCHQAISKLRKRFAAFGIVEKTADHIVNRAAARFRWLLPGTVP